MTTYDEIFPGQAPVLPPAPIQAQQADFGGEAVAVAPSLAQPSAKPRAAYRAPVSHGGFGRWFFRFLLMIAVLLTAAFWFYPTQVRQAAQQFAVQYEQRQWEQDEGPALVVQTAQPLPVAQTPGAKMAQRVLANKATMKNQQAALGAPKKVLVIRSLPVQPSAKTAATPVAKAKSASRAIKAPVTVAYSPGGDPIPTFSLASFQQTLALHQQARAQGEADRSMGTFEGPVAAE